MTDLQPEPAWQRAGPRSKPRAPHSDRATRLERVPKPTANAAGNPDQEAHFAALINTYWASRGYRVEANASTGWVRSRLYAGMPIGYRSRSCSQAA